MDILSAFMFICAPHVYLVAAEVRRQTTVSEPLELELHMVVSHHENAKNRIQVL